MTFEVQLGRIDQIREEETRIEALNHAFSTENAHKQFSYTVLLTTVSAFVATFIGILFTFLERGADQLNAYFALLFLFTSVTMLCAVFLTSLQEFEQKTNYMVAIVQLIIQKQGTVEP